jgi:hypothetical protein
VRSVPAQNGAGWPMQAASILTERVICPDVLWQSQSGSRIAGRRVSLRSVRTERAGGPLPPPLDHSVSPE